MSETALSRARVGDSDAFRELIDPYRAELQLHCYGILGSLQDAEDQSISAITWFGERSLVPRFGLPRTLPQEG